jgi:hypothetical protein
MGALIPSEFERVEMRATIQLCTYNRAHLLGRVLDACFEQTVPSASYEVVLVNDGSTDGSAAVIEAARGRATCAFVVVEQPNAGLARARNAGIARARGERIIFIDDDVLPTPVFVAEHLRSHDRRPAAIVRGAVINTESFDRLPTPTWTLANYSANYFLDHQRLVAARDAATAGKLQRKLSRVRLGRHRTRDAAAGRGRARCFQSFRPGLSLQAATPRAKTSRVCCAKRARRHAPPLQLRQLHPHWRVVLATGDDPLRRTFHRGVRSLGLVRALERRVGDRAADRALGPGNSRRRAALARERTFPNSMLERARRAAP